MPAAFLCVQFRNLLPSEELVRVARSSWTDLQLRCAPRTQGDATLSITQTSCESAPFHAELHIDGSPLLGAARDDNPLAAVREVFAQARSRRERLACEALRSPWA